MLRSVGSKAAWVGRTASMVFGLALVMALVLGVATTALGANGGNFILGSLNNTATALTRLTGDVDGPAMQVVNTDADANDTALSLRVQAGEAPMTVNSGTKVAGLNADRIDDRDASSFANAVHAHAGEQITSGKVEADRVEDGSGSNLNADQLDGLNSTALWSGGIYTTISEEPGFANDTRYVQRSCDAGDKALSGGYSYALPGDYQVIQDLVYNNMYHMGWHSGDTAVTAFVYITCADFGSPHGS